MRVCGAPKRSSAQGTAGEQNPPVDDAEKPAPYCFVIGVAQAGRRGVKEGEDVSFTDIMLAVLRTALLHTFWSVASISERCWWDSLSRSNWCGASQRSWIEHSIEPVWEANHGG